MSIRLVPIERKPAEQQVTDNLRNFLLSGGVAAGSKLTETEVATHLGVSRATARSGMHRLAGEGILVQVPYTGWQVMPITPEDVWELWTLRGSLEGLAARLVCESMTENRRQAILDSFNALKRAAENKQRDAINDRDFGFHRTLVEMTGHQRLLRQYVTVENQIRLYIAVSNQLLADDYLSIIDQHQPMIDALLNADADLAREEAWAHNESEGRKLIAYLDERDA